MATGTEAMRYGGHQGMLSAAAFDPAGKTVASAGGDSTVLLWDLTGRRAPRPAAPSLSWEDLRRHWHDLASADATAAYHAMQGLVASPRAAVPFLIRQFQPPLPANAVRIKRLIADLDSKSFPVRQKAAEQLDQLDSSAIGAVQEVLGANPSLEVRQRLEQFLSRHQGGDRKIQAMHTVEVFEEIGSPDSIQALKKLIKDGLDPVMTREANASVDRLTRRASVGP